MGKKLEFIPDLGLFLLCDAKHIAFFVADRIVTMAPILPSKKEKKMMKEGRKELLQEQ
jgi:hypothetical protein